MLLNCKVLDTLWIEFMVGQRCGLEVEVWVVEKRLHVFEFFG